MDKQETFYFIQDLVDFMKTDISYNVKRLLPADLKEIYLYSSDFFENEKVDEKYKNPFDEDFSVCKNFEVGGVTVTENVVYNCLLQEEWACAIEEEIYNTPFECSHCKKTKLGYSVFKIMQHETYCESKIKVVPSDSTEKDDVIKPNSKLFHCTVCQKDLYLTPVDILKHKKSCK